MDPRLKGQKLQATAAAPHPKLTAGPAFFARLHPDDVISAVVRVARPDYVPHGVLVRTRISPLLFTATLSKSQLDSALDDPAVVTIQPTQPVSAECVRASGGSAEGSI